MDRWNVEAERCVRDRDKRRWAPLLMTGALVCYALTGIMAVGMLAEMRHNSVIVCGISEIAMLDGATPTPFVEPQVAVEELRITVFSAYPSREAVSVSR